MVDYNPSYSMMHQFLQQLLMFHVCCPVCRGMPIFLSLLLLYYWTVLDVLVVACINYLLEIDSGDLLRDVLLICSLLFLLLRLSTNYEFVHLGV